MTTPTHLRLFLFALSLPVLLLLPATTGTVETHADATDDDVVLTYDDADALNDVLDELVDLGWATKVDYADAKVLVIEADDAEAATATAVIAALAALPGVGEVERNLVLSIEPDRDGHQSQMAAFDDELGFSHVPSQAAMTGAGLVATPETAGSTTVTIGIVDGGFELGHGGVSGLTVSAEWDAIDGDSDADDLGNDIDDDGNGNVDDGQGHGTAIMSVIGAMVPDADYIVVRALDDEGHGTIGAIAAAIDYCRANGADVINLSLGDSSWSNVIESMLSTCQAQGVLVVAATGNSGVDGVNYPASSTNSLAVTSVDANDNRAGWANYGIEVNIAVEGCDIIAAYGGTSDGYARWCGTSLSVPIVAAAAAIRVQEGDSTDGWDAGQDLLTNAAAHPPLPPNEVGKMGDGLLDAN